MSDGSSQSLDEAIERLLRRFRGRLDPSEIASKLTAAASSLTDAPAEKGVTYDEVTGTLHVVFDDPGELEDRLSEFIDLRALVVTAAVPLHRDVVVRVSGRGRAVELMGRVVQELPSGRCIQIDRLDTVTEQRLRALPTRMVEEPSVPPSPMTGRFDRPETGARRHPSQDPVPQVDVGGFERRPTLADHVPLSPSRTWNLADDPLWRPLYALVGNNATGMLEVGNEPRRLILIDRGSIVDVGALPERSEDSLETLLQRSGTIDEDDARRVSDYRNQYGVGSSEALVNLGIVDWNELQIGLRSRIRYLLKGVWHLTGEAKFYPLETLPAKPLAKPVQINSFVFAHRAEHFADEDTDLGEFEGLLFRPLDELPPVLSQIEVLPQQEDVLTLRFLQAKSLREIVRLSRSTRSEALAAVESLHALGFLQADEFRPISRVQTRSVQQIDMLFARIATNNHFDVFGLHWSAYSQEVKERYAELGKKFEPSQFGDVLTGELEERLRQVNDRVEEAWQVLRSDRLRKKHRAEVVDEFQIENSIDMFESKADTAIFRREIQEAITFLSRVVELDPSRVELVQKIRQLSELA